jgi:predicted dehydrogenase
MAEKLRVGLVGTGFGTHVHLPAYRACDAVEVVAVCSAQLPRAKKAAEDFGVPWYTDDYRQLVQRSDVDLVDVCTPPDTHLEITLAAIDAGKHVLAEKPLALDATQATAMRDQMAGAGLVNVVNHEMRYTPVRRRIRGLVAEGFLGRVQYVVATVNADHGTDPSKEPYYWGWVGQADKGGGFLMSSLSHHIDLLRFCFGDIDGVQGRVTTLITERPVLTFEYRDGDPIGADTPTVGLRAVDADDTAVFTGTLAGGGLISVSGSWSIRFPGGVRLEAYGDRGSLHLMPDGRLLGARNGDAELTELRPEATLPSIPGAHYLVPNFVALATEMAEVVNGSLDQKEAIFATFEDGARLQAIIDEVKGAPNRAGSAPGSGT